VCWHDAGRYVVGLTYTRAARDDAVWVSTTQLIRKVSAMNEDITSAEIEDTEAHSASGRLVVENPPSPDAAEDTEGHSISGRFAVENPPSPDAEDTEGHSFNGHV
jgi:hypothetical protein